jgi:predicted S18 family serine protease
MNNHEIAKTMEEANELLKSLHQQLAQETERGDQYLDFYNVATNRLLDMNAQLTAALAACKQKDEALANMLVVSGASLIYALSDDEDQARARKALNIQPCGMPRRRG